MNLILFTEDELPIGLPLSDPRAQHIRHVLRVRPGESFDIGIVDGPRGKASVARADGERLYLDFELLDPPRELFPVTLFVGLSRPQSMRRILRDCTALGVERFVFFESERGEAGYAESGLWSSGEVRRLLIEGAQQAFSTRLPVVEIQESLRSCLPDPTGILAAALDNYEAPTSLASMVREQMSSGGRRGDPAVRVALFVGSERGWSGKERELLRESHLGLAHLGERVLRTEVACIAAVGIVLSELGWFDDERES